MKIEDAVRRILDLDRDGKVKFIIMYGSRARGEARKDSDVDLCIYYDGTKGEAFVFFSESFAGIGHFYMTSHTRPLKSSGILSGNGYIGLEAIE